ncbi:IclR family transcriptional regulator [Tepidibacillus infernus]|uniref:IclR family transcriptional regulator n=1 Tax=Tepidibacillus infernus TaxID=1806172 RepID=UPI003B6C8936
MEGQPSEKKSTVRAVERSLDILMCFVDETELSLTEIAKRIALHKSTVFRLLHTLEQKGFLIRNPETEKYRLGYRIWELSSNLMGLNDPATLLLPEMEQLRDLLGETISLYVRDGYERIRIQSVEGNQSIRRVAPIGARMPLSVGASSKILLAYEDLITKESLLKQLETLYGINTNLFKQLLEKTKQNGYATSFEERETGAAAISVPIFNRSGKLVAALSVSGPINRLTLTKMKEMVPILKETALNMGKKVR